MNVESNDLLNPILAKKIIIATISILSLLFVIHPFIDGTVAGTDIHTGHIDSHSGHDYTYYGNGCPNAWDGDDAEHYHGGSLQSCTTRIVPTYDSENQKNGTYYVFQAATSGSGWSATMPDDTNTADTFCPLGWQLPYGGTDGDYYDKSRSWKYLLDTYGLSYGDGKEASSIKVRSYPLSNILSGYYSQTDAALFYQGNNGLHWSTTSHTGGYAFLFSIWPKALFPMVYTYKQYSYTLRCNCEISILE